MVGCAFNPALVRAYDLRGAVGVTLGAEDARGLGLAFAALLRQRGGGRVAVARDGRLSSPMLAGALVDGLMAGGAEVVDLGLGPTPLMSWAMREMGLDGAVMVTGSHNPLGENGFKLLAGAAAVHGAALAALCGAPGAEGEGGSVRRVELLDDYSRFLAGAAAGAPALRVVWDCGHGSTGPVVERLARALPGEHHVLFGAPDGRFPAHHPDPSVPANLDALRAAVVEGGYDLGIAFDGDGDRIGAVDGEGAIVWPDELMLLLAREVLEERPGAAIVADVKSSTVLFDGVRERGGRAVMGPSGYVRVAEWMARLGAPLAGELSGHIFFEERGADDALYVAMRLLRVLGRTSLAAFRRSLPVRVATPEIRFATAEAPRVVAELAARVEGAVLVDGVRAERTEGWWLLRASGTEDKLTARVEARDAEGLAALRAELAGLLRTSGVELPEG